ncbi:MAG: thymidylate kinase [Planctomycetes bacterium]|nr:thymidylate kinase [Planctomycetota bacterium]
MRGTQIAQLKEWLQVEGYGVVETGWSRSALMAKSIDAAKAGNMLNPLTFSLLYATDFADRLEKQIIPALRAGFVVLADRYIYTAFARDFVRGADPTWVRELFSFALVPDLVCYLRIGVDDLIQRVLESGGMNYWESGMDLRLGTDLFDCFRKYQGLLLKEFDRMTEPYGFHVVDASKPIDKIQAQLRTMVAPLLPKSRRGGTAVLSAEAAGAGSATSQAAGASAGAVAGAPVAGAAGPGAAVPGADSGERTPAPVAVAAAGTGPEHPADGRTEEEGRG